ncbi:Poly [ADP-ribose] polymerase [Aphelenchoides bicaudatus]|nr:Poly [ADP-ribose] polymerase [Aphelenchoides bicaudatus]
MVHAPLPQQTVNPLFTELGNYDDRHVNVGQYLAKANQPFIKQYAQNVGPMHSFGIEVVNVWSVNRPGCRQNYRHTLTNKRLLFHGTLKENVFPILCDGFDMSLSDTSSFFGAGLYFSDCVTKAASYANEYRSAVGSYAARNPEMYGYLFLCEVALGRQKRYLDADNNACQDLAGHNSVYSQGSYGAMSATAQYSQDVMIIPGKIRFFKRNRFHYNVYVVYATNQVNIR